MTSTEEKSNVSSGDMLQPGLIIRPQMTEKTAIHLVKTLYGLTVRSIKELNSYDDKNYLVQVDAEHTNPHLETLWPHGYVLKVLNSMDSPKQHVDAEHEMMRILWQNKLGCSRPVTNLNGQLCERCKVWQDMENIDLSNNNAPCGIHMVRLMTYLPGQIFAQIPYTPDILYQVGRFAGAMDRCLQGFEHPALTQHKTIWSLQSVPGLSDFVYAIRDEENRKLIQEVLDVWGKEVEPLYEHFSKGVIHGDFNEQNIIVQPKPDQDDVPDQEKKYQIYGVIDFGDAQYTYHVFEAAIGIMYMMVESHVIDPLLVGGHVLAGYLKERELNEWEWKALRVCIAGRFAQSLTMGEYTYSQDPGNEYVLVCAKNGWKRLRALWTMPEEQLYAGWREIIDSYKQQQ